MLNLWIQEPAIPDMCDIVFHSDHCDDCDLTEVLVVSLLIALDVEERISVPELLLPRPTQRDGGGLAVSDQHLPGGIFHITRAGPAVQTSLAWRTSVALQQIYFIRTD